MTDIQQTYDFEQDIFTLPTRIAASERYVRMHQEYVTRLRRDAHGLEFSTLQLTMIERIANGYVLLRWHEDNPGNWVGVNTEKDFTLNWRALVIEFNKVLSSGEDKRRDALRLIYQDILIDGLKKIPDDETKRMLRTFYMDKFSAIGE